MKRILITVPGKEARGGINSFFSAIKPFNKNNTKYLTRGSRNYPKRDSLLNQVVRLVMDYARFIHKLLTYKPEIVHINLTLDKRGLIRDSVFVILSSLYRRSKLLVFFHGWDSTFINSFKGIHIAFIRYIANKSDALVVLSNEFQNVLESWGCKKKIFVLTTAVDNQLIDRIDLDILLNKSHNEAFVLLFLARIEKEKGIHIALDTYKILKTKYPNITFHIAGDGTELELIKKRIADEEIADVQILGHLTGHDIQKAFLAADLYIFPTFYKEGLPTSVLEAVCFGLPVITRPVAGIKDIFEDEEMGLMINSLNADDFAIAIERIYKDDILRRRIITYNYYKGRKEFTGDKIANKLEMIYSFLYD